MKVAMTGATGLVGSALTKALTAENHTVIRLTRPQEKKRTESTPGVVDFSWDARSGEFSRASDSPLSSGVDAIINLAGAPIVEGRWTDERKKLLHSSRIDTTRGLISAIAKLNPKPRVLVSASAVGFYGDRGDEVLSETSAPGAGFLADLAKEWEAEARQAQPLDVRVVSVRFGIILSKDGGALPPMMAPFKFGLGGKLGTGKQWMSWVALRDVVAIIRQALQDDLLAGPLNIVAPEPLRNAAFTEILAQVLHRPAMFAAPAFVLRLAMGEMADEALLASERVVPEALLRHGYKFLHTDLRETLQTILR
jgi:uncharacterized protein (TIGR01777 family)